MGEKVQIGLGGGETCLQEQEAFNKQDWGQYQAGKTSDV